MKFLYHLIFVFSTFSFFFLGGEGREEALVDARDGSRVHAERVAVDPDLDFPFFLLFFRADVQPFRGVISQQSFFRALLAEVDGLGPARGIVVSRLCLCSMA